MAASTASSNPQFTLETPSDREIVITRIFDAPRRLVFEAWTKPEHVTQWWGCEGSKLSVCEIDLRPGGAWRFVLALPDGKDYRMKGVYREIDPPKRLVQTQIFDVEPWTAHEAIVTVTLDEHQGQTTLTWAILHQSKEARDAQINIGVKEGTAHAWNRLATLLRTIE